LLLVLSQQPIRTKWEESVSETDEKLWEDRLREMLSGLLSRRLDPLTSELSSLKDTFDEACARIVTEARSADNTGLDAVAREIRNQFSQSEKQFTGEIESLRINHAFASRAERATLNSAIAEIDRQRTQAGVLAAMILGASSFAARVALFVVRSGNVVGWRGAGFGQEGDDASLSLLSVPIEDRTLLGDALNRRQSVSVSNATESGTCLSLGTHREDGTTTSVAVPLIVRDKAAAVLYADTSARRESTFSRSRRFVRVASMAIELLPLRRSTEPFTTDLPAPRIFTSSLETAPVTNRLETPGRRQFGLTRVSQSDENPPSSALSASIAEPQPHRRSAQTVTQRGRRNTRDKFYRQYGARAR
jgi:hypothetical protein